MTVEQAYDRTSGDPICRFMEEPNAWSFLCEHEPVDGEPHARVLMGQRGQRLDCEDCGTAWVIWERAGKTLAKAVVVRVG